MSAVGRLAPVPASAHPEWVAAPVAAALRHVRAGAERFGVCMTPATTRVDANNVVRRYLDGRKGSFVPVDEAVVLTGLEFGGITPVGVPAGWPILDRPGGRGRSRLGAYRLGRAGRA